MQEKHSQQIGVIPRGTQRCNGGHPIQSMSLPARRRKQLNTPQYPALTNCAGTCFFPLVMETYSRLSPNKCSLSCTSSNLLAAFLVQDRLHLLVGAIILRAKSTPEADTIMSVG